MKIAVYARVSTDSEDQANSLENQKSYFEHAIQQKEDCDLYRIFADQGLTGTKLNNRPEFNRMLQAAGIDIIETYTNQADKRLKKKHVLYEVSDREPFFDEIWIKNTSRFARNTLSFDIISKLRDKGVHIRFLEQNLCTADIGTDFLLKLFQLFDEQDSRDKSLKVRTGQRESARKGKIWSGGGRIFGYSYDQPTNSLHIIESEATIIRKVFDMYAAGLGFRRIINNLTQAGHFTRLGKPFGKTSLTRILENEKYAGINVRMKWDAGYVFSYKGNPQKRPEEEWIVVDTDKIPAIIDKSLFDKCQEIKHGRVNYQNQVGVYKGTTAYAGLIFCGCCGAPYNSNVDKGRRFYNCMTKKNKGTGVCNAKNLSEKAIGEILMSEVYYYTKKSGIHAARTALNAIREGLEQQLAGVSVYAIKTLEDQIADIEAEGYQLTKALMKRLIDEREYELHKVPLNEQREALVAQLKALTEPKADTEGKIAEIDLALGRLEDMENQLSIDTPREEIIKDIDKIIVVGTNELQVKFKMQIDETKVKLDDTLVTITYGD